VDGQKTFLDEDEMHGAKTDLTENSTNLALSSTI